MGDDTGEIRKDIRDLREKTVEYGRDLMHLSGDLRELLTSHAKHEAEDDARFARVESLIVGENGLMQRLSKQESSMGVGKWFVTTVLGSLITIAATLGWAIVSGFLKAGGGP